jgi:hypothetical protein
MNLFKNVKTKLFPGYKPSSSEELVIDIIKSLLEDEKTECITAPISEKFYVTNKKLNYYVKVSYDTVVITNHKFSYTLKSPLKFHELLCNIVLEYIEKDREEFEKTVFENEIDLLTNIKTNIKYNGDN